MSNDPISLEQGIQILSRAFSSMRGNPAGWEDKLGNGGASGETVRIPRPRHGFGGEDDPSVEVPGAQQMPAPPGTNDKGYPPGWSPRPYAQGDMASNKYGPHNPVLSDQEAATLHLVWSILGIDGSTVGNGGTVEIAPHNQIVGHTKDGKPIWGRPSGDYFNGQLDPKTPGDLVNPLGTPVPFGQGIVQEPGMNDVGMNRVAPAPYGYTAEGRPKLNPHDTAGATGISEFAPGRIYGPTVNKYKPTEAESAAQSHDKRMI